MLIFLSVEKNKPVSFYTTQRMAISSSSITFLIVRAKPVNTRDWHIRTNLCVQILKTVNACILQRALTILIHKNMTYEGSENSPQQRNGSHHHRISLRWEKVTERKKKNKKALKILATHIHLRKEATKNQGHIVGYFLFSPVTFRAKKIGIKLYSPLSCPQRMTHRAKGKDKGNSSSVSLSFFPPVLFSGAHTYLPSYAEYSGTREHKKGPPGV